MVHQAHELVLANLKVRHPQRLVGSLSVASMKCLAGFMCRPRSLRARAAAATLVRSLSHVQLFVSPWTVARQAPWGLLGKNTGVSCHFLLQGIFLDLSPALATDSFPLSHQGSSVLLLSQLFLNPLVQLISVFWMEQKESGHLWKHPAQLRKPGPQSHALILPDGWDGGPRHLK